MPQNMGEVGAAVFENTVDCFMFQCLTIIINRITVNE